MALFPLAIARMSTPTMPRVAAMAAQLLLLAAIFQFSDGIQVTANGALRGLKDTTVPMAITVFAYWGIGMPVGYWLAFHAGLRRARHVDGPDRRPDGGGGAAVRCALPARSRAPAAPRMRD